MRGGEGYIIDAVREEDGDSEHVVRLYSDRRGTDTGVHLSREEVIDLVKTLLRYV